MTPAPPERIPRPVAITGLAVISPLGCTVPDFWAGLTGGAVGTGPVRRFAAARYGTQNGGEVSGFTPDHLVGLLPEATARRLPLSVQYAVSATGAALRDAGLDPADPGYAGTGICMGTVMGTRPHLERLAGESPELGTGRECPGSAALASVPARVCGLGGPQAVLASGCAAGNDAIGHAVDLIAYGAADRMVAGGAEELSEAVYALFTSLRAVSRDVVRPFDERRTGILPAEGAAALVLEPAAHARARGARGYARILGYACGADAHHLTAPHPDGRALVRCVREVLDRAGHGPADVGYVNAHGTGTPLSDGVECAALAGIFGPDNGPPVSSIKGALGHAQGAAGAFEAVACALAIRDGMLPGMPTLREPDPACAVVDLVTGPGRASTVDVALSVGFGFGGATSALLLGAA